MKKCFKCKNEKQFVYFSKNKTRKDGYDAKCKECSSTISKLWKQNNKLYAREKNRVWMNKKHHRDPRAKMLSHSKHTAKRKNLEHNLVIEDIIIPELCPVFGIKLEVGSKKREECSPSLDRIDNNKGYIKGNIIVVSWKANRMKNNFEINDLRILVEFYSSRRING